MGAAERRKKVVECVLVGQVNNGHLSGPLVFFGVEQIVIAYCEIEQMSRCDPWWIMVVVFCAWCGDGDESGSILRSRTQASPETRTDRHAQWMRGAGRQSMNSAAKQASLELLVGSNDRGINHCVAAQWAIRTVPTGTGHRSGDQSAVISPIEPHPRAILPRLVLQVCRLIEFLIVVYTENSGWSRRSCTGTAKLGSEETSRYGGEDH